MEETKICYRLYTEDKNREYLEKLLIDSISVEGFTMFKAIGYWAGFKEASLCIEIIGPRSLKPRITMLAELIRHANKQTAVYFVSFEVEAKLLDGGSSLEENSTANL